MPDFPPPPVFELEGDYSTYTEKWAVNDPDGLGSTGLHPDIQYDGDVLFIKNPEDTRLLLLDLTDGSHIDSVTFTLYLHDPSSGCAASFRRYTAAFVQNTGLKVYKDGVLLGTYLLDIKDSYAVYVAMSLDGKYILAADIAPSPLVWHLLEGS